MDRYWLDDLARALATGRSRRQVLTVLGASVAGTAVSLIRGPGAVAAKRCHAAGGRCGSDLACCAGLVCDGSTCQAGCHIDGVFYPGGAAKPGTPCQVCQPATSTSTWTNRPSGASCGAAGACTGPATCDGKGTCVQGAPLDCNNGNPCTDDHCDPAQGCLHAPLADGTPCDGGSCRGGVCSGSGPRYFTTCGDPVCRGWTPKPGTPLCTTEQEGQPCSTPGSTCDPKSPCNQLLDCSASDPKTRGCPISRRQLKQEIAYLTGQERARLHDELLQIRLASYRYRAASPDEPRRLGFLIDDQEGSAAILPNGEQVDLYGYTSMAVAALQEQARQLERLQHEVARLRLELAAAANGGSSGVCLSR